MRGGWIFGDGRRVGGIEERSIGERVVYWVVDSVSRGVGIR